MASRTYPMLEDVDPRRFTKALAGTEIALGATLLAPVVPAWVAGMGLGAFAGGLLNLYAHTPGLHREHSILPTADGMAIAKDSWLLGIAVALVIDRARPRRHRDTAAA